MADIQSRSPSANVSSIVMEKSTYRPRPEQEAQRSPLNRALKIVLIAAFVVTSTLTVTSLSLTSKLCRPTDSHTSTHSSSHFAERPAQRESTKTYQIPPAATPDAASKLGPVKGCGQSMEEALKAGCVYDSIYPAWVPPECYDRDLELAYRGNWTWYTTREATHVVPWSLVETGRYQVLYTDHEYHVQHCLYLVQKLSAALSKAQHGQQAWIEKLLLSNDHTQHCIGELHKPREEGNQTVARVLQSFQYCLTIDWPGIEDWLDED